MRQLKIRRQITNRKESTSLEKYLNDVSKFDVLKVDEEVEAFKELELLNSENKKLPDQFNEIDDETKKKIETVVDKISKANLRFVVSVAKQYQQFKIPLQDLINEGNRGMVKAIYRFDYTKGFKFISYAVWRIRQSILQHIAENSPIRIPMNQNGRINRIQKYINKIEQTEYRTPTDEEIKEEFELSDTEFKHYLDAVSAVKLKSLDEKINNDENEDDFKSIVVNVGSKRPDFDLEQQSTKEAILSTLDTDLKKPNGLGKPDPKEIIRLCFYENKTLEEIAERFGISRERVRQIRDKALKHLRNNKTLQDLYNSLNE